MLNAIKTGSIAEEYSDVGRYAEEDRCCREHDLCPQTLSPGECKKGLCNQQQFTRSHCECDAKFRRCLQQLNTETANTLGAVFFNVVQVTCFKERRPCSTHQSSKSNCSYGFYKSESYISAPLLSALNSGQLKPHVYHVSNSEMNARSMYSNAFHSPNSRIFAKETPMELENSIRLASLGLAAKNIFHDMVVRRLIGFTRLLKLATHILES
ncbi:acidic phospholipase A2 PA4 isoform X3 [Contarinia nasturtii]|uniref:acidic phospholipase A2 PA4 isoform X3 n=1 Tax=Contarinia nasturtii TaxID=265458 RepID=UPI0012D3D2D4|nr:acidic phospholipase A2 PA4 isoform X3 [Contarinia nasturtii]